MAHPPLDLRAARVLISNDDGIGAPGLALLEEVVRPLAGDVWVVAPETEQSAASHSLTMRRPLYVRRAGEQRFTVDGTPTDCVLLAIHQVMKDCPPDIVLSGINRGGNLGEDAIYSGTVAAAREGALLGVRAIAFSQMNETRQPAPWATARAWTAPVLERLAACSWPKGVLINVNFPELQPEQVTGIDVTRQGRHKIGAAIVAGRDPRGEPYFWIGSGRDEDRDRPGTDLAAVSRGRVAITPLALDTTHVPTVTALARALGEIPPRTPA